MLSVVPESEVNKLCSKNTGLQCLGSGSLNLKWFKDGRFFKWPAAEQNDPDWWPQGVASSGAAQTGLLWDYDWVIVAWYSKKSEGLFCFLNSEKNNVVNVICCF